MVGTLCALWLAFRPKESFSKKFFEESSSVIRLVVSLMCEEKDRFRIPDWVGKPPAGTHLDVTKNDGLIQVNDLAVILIPPC